MEHEKKNLPFYIIIRFWRVYAKERFQNVLNPEKNEKKFDKKLSRK